MPGSKTNKMDKPLKRLNELSGEVAWNDYEHRDKFAHVCEVTPGKRPDEKLVITDADEANLDRSCVYVMVIGGRVFKIGSALNGMKDRISSYNCGTIRFRARGTCSTTNYWVLQSLLNLAKPAQFYGFFPELKEGKVFGEKFREPFPSAKKAEKVVLQLFVDTYGQKPIGCTQG